MPLIKKVQVGRIVGYVHKVDMQEGVESPNVSPAMIVQVYEDKVVDLVVFHGNGIFFAKKVQQGSGKERQTWHWLRLLGDDNG